MANGGRVCCILCGRSEETKVTGPLSTKCEVTAHQNCLLFASGIYCQESPLHDDLFGFFVHDVMDEVKRGKKLKCHHCKRSGATAGCGNSRCKKSYHYPCAVEEGVRTDEDIKNGKYELYCPNTVNRKVKTPKRPQSVYEITVSMFYCHEVLCLTCEKKEGNISLESCFDGFVMLYCAEHAPASLKRNTNGDSSGAGPSRCSSSDSTSSGCSRLSSKRRISSDEDEGMSPSKRKSNISVRRISEDSSNSDENTPGSEWAPLEFDINGSVYSVHDSEPPAEPQLIRKDTESHTGSISGHQPEDESSNEADETLIPSDAESESLLLPVTVCVDSPSLPVTTSDFSVQTEVRVEEIMIIKREKGSSPEPSPVPSPDPQPAEPSVPEQSSTAPSPSPDRSEPGGGVSSPLCTKTPFTAAPLEPISITIHSSPPLPAALLPSVSPEPSIDPTSFWKSCNATGCTQAIFTDFMNEMNLISGRIQSDQASQEDYDQALKVMEASGKLVELVTKQQKELERKQGELEKAAAAMTEVISLLKR
nr:flocculation protein FLO11-like [Labrus bergylta]